MSGSVAAGAFVGRCCDILWFVHRFSGQLMLLGLVVDVIHSEFVLEEFHLEDLVRAPGCHHGYDELIG